MSRLLLLLIPLLPVAAFSQGGFETAVPPEPLQETLHIEPGRVFVEGHWVALDEHSKLTGPSVSTITCFRTDGVCQEEQANIAVMGNTFALSAAHAEYTIERWTAKDIVASNITGVCRVRVVIKIDIAARRVYSSQTLSEPLDEKLPKLSKDTCSLVGMMNLELKASTLWLKK